MQEYVKQPLVTLYLNEHEKPMKTFAICKRFKIGLEHMSIKQGGFRSDNGTIWLRDKDKLWHNYNERKTQL
jgi:hypothetical protein